MLTRKQQELLLYINGRITEDGVSPSFDEMKDALGLKSKSGIHRLITGLVERKFLQRIAHRARALEVLRLPTTAGIMPGAPDAEADAEKGNVLRPDFQPRPTAVPNARASSSGTGGTNPGASIPLFGRIAAGTPIEALRDPGNFIDVPGHLLGRGEHFALEVAGDSMIDAGIYEGDTVLIERCDTADPGSIVVALIDDQEAMLKRLRRNKGSIALESANPKYETRIFGPDRVKIQGRLVGLLRRY
ncbi:MAG: transcriptional repressor LexA [Alphaproteobacteria bacterium]|nr:transcriptional repressor LexA [Alphaproteobacteria bacterium]